MRLEQRNAVVENLQKLRKLSVKDKNEYHIRVMDIIDDNWATFRKKPIINNYEMRAKMLCNMIENYYILFFNLKDIKEVKETLDGFAQEAIECLEAVSHIK